MISLAGGLPAGDFAVPWLALVAPYAGAWIEKKQTYIPKKII